MEIWILEYAEKHGNTPPSRPLGELTSDRDFLVAGGSALRGVDPAPMEALTGYKWKRPDPFSVDPHRSWWARRFRPPSEGRWPLAYHRDPDGSRWVIWSLGTDGVYDLRDPGSLDRLDDEERDRILVGLAYDPTNGAKSRGDIFQFGR